MFTFQIHSLALNTEKPMSRQREENRQERKDNICLHCPAKKHTRNSEKTKSHRCAGSAHQPRTCLLDNTKLCTSKRVQTGNCGNTRTCMFPSVHVRCRFANAFKTVFPRMCTTYLRIDFASHIGHFTTLYFTGCGSVRIDN